MAETANQTFSASASADDDVVSEERRLRWGEFSFRDVKKMKIYKILNFPRNFRLEELSYSEMS